MVNYFLKRQEDRKKVGIRRLYVHVPHALNNMLSSEVIFCIEIFSSEFQQGIAVSV